MKYMESALRPVSILLVIIFMLAPAYGRMASAAMIGTEVLLTPDRHQDRRDFLLDLVTHEEIQKVLAARGISPDEARARINSLSDDELDNILKNITDLPAGGDATGFAVIVGVVLIILIVIVEYFSEVKMFPQLFPKDSDETQEE
jgi:hypothetical protein